MEKTGKEWSGAGHRGMSLRLQCGGWGRRKKGYPRQKSTLWHNACAGHIVPKPRMGVPAGTPSLHLGNILLKHACSTFLRSLYSKSPFSGSHQLLLPRHAGLSIWHSPLCLEPPPAPCCPVYRKASGYSEIVHTYMHRHADVNTHPCAADLQSPHFLVKTHCVPLGNRAS